MKLYAVSVVYQEVTGEHIVSDLVCGLVEANSPYEAVRKAILDRKDTRAVVLKSAIPVDPENGVWFHDHG